jgi:DNA-binding transcriptional MerR regulator
MTAAQIATAAEIGFTLKEIKKIIEDPLFRLKLGQYNKKMDSAIIERATEEMAKFPEVELAKGQLATHAEKAARVLTNIIDRKSAISKLSIHERRLIASVAQDILNRVGLKETSKDESTKSAREYSPEEIKSALSNAKELEAISNRLDQQGSSYVLTKEQRMGIDTEHGEGPDFISEPSFEQTVTDGEEVTTS